VSDICSSKRKYPHVSAWQVVVPFPVITKGDYPVIESPPQVHDYESAVRFILWCVAVLGLGYHPDTPFAAYVDEHGQRTFGPKQADELDKWTTRAFEYCDPYEIGYDAFQHLLGTADREAQTD
jgi:hypothetical protein